MLSGANSRHTKSKDTQGRIAMQPDIGSLRHDRYMDAAAHLPSSERQWKQQLTLPKYSGGLISTLFSSPEIVQGTMFSPKKMCCKTSIVNTLFRDYFPDTNLIELPTLDLGNNDFPSDYYINVTSQEPCLPILSDDGFIESYPEATNEWLKAVAELQSDTFADELQKTTFACGGYMIRDEVKSSLSIIILNTVIWTLGWKQLSPEPFDPSKYSRRSYNLLYCE